MGHFATLGGMSLAGQQLPAWADFASFNGLPSFGVVSTFLLVFVLNGFGEETGWRGALLVRSRRFHINDFEFAAYHLLVLHWLFPSEWLLLVGALFTLTVSAWFWRQLRDAFGMVVVVAFHAAAIVWASYALAQKQLLVALSSVNVLLLIYVGASIVLLPLATPAQILDLTPFQLALLAFGIFNTQIV